MYNDSVIVAVIPSSFDVKLWVFLGQRTPTHKGYLWQKREIIAFDNFSTAYRVDMVGNGNYSINTDRYHKLKSSNHTRQTHVECRDLHYSSWFSTTIDIYDLNLRQIIRDFAAVCCYNNQLVTYWLSSSLTLVEQGIGNYKWQTDKQGGCVFVACNQGEADPSSRF